VLIVAISVPAAPIFQIDARAQALDRPAPQASSDFPPAVKSAQAAVVEIGDAVALNRRYETAIRIYATAPIKTAEIWNKMGISYQMMFNTKEAIRCYRESLKVNPDDPKVLNNLATLYESMKDYGTADRLLRKALAIDPHFARIYKNLGLSLVAQRKYEEGRAALERAIALDPTVFEDAGDPTSGSGAQVHERGAMFYYMAQACARIGQTGRAVDYLAISLNDGFTDPQQVAMDSNFAAIVRDPAFQQLLAQQRNP
jgi:tetratricopeptide (TPR) repeat protein